MDAQPPSRAGQPAPESESGVQQQPRHEQARPDDAYPIPASTSSIMQQGTVLQQVDLVTPDPNDDNDDEPPPAYGDIHSVVGGNEKDGLGTRAQVTDDGRVNININQLNRRFSQIFTPALRQQLQSIEESQPPAPPYIPPYLGGDQRLPPPPCLNVVIQVVGSRGDVQPFVALGKVLKDAYGHRVRLATHPNFRHFVEENGLEFFSIGGDPSQLMAFMVKNPGLMPGVRTLLNGDVAKRRRDVAECLQRCWRSCYLASDDEGLQTADDEEGRSEAEAKPFVADCIIANPPSFAHIHCAEKLGIPLHIMFTMPYSPTQAFPHPLANIQSSNTDPQITNYITYTMIELLTWRGIGDIVNRFRAKCLNLDPISLIWAPGMLQRLKIPHTYCWSPALIPKPKDWGAHISVAGFYLLNLASNYTPSPELQAFLDDGPPPIYIGFGSIVLDDPDAMTELIYEAAKKTGQRILLSKGWGGMGADERSVPDAVFMLGNVPHDWLFKNVSCVVHHGGAGTTAAGIAAGRPTIVVPFFGDQPFWGSMVARAGAGPDPIRHKQLTADKLASAIEFCLKPESLERAKELASKIAAEQGCDTGAQSFHQFLEPDRLRCTLVPSRPAAWYFKSTRVRLSAFAAYTLAKQDILDWHDLKLFRSQEHNTDQGPWDPVSGGAAACYRAFSGMAMGLAEVPTETFKALQFPSKSQESLPSSAKGKKKSSIVDGSGPPTSPATQSQTSLSRQESLNPVRTPSNLSGISTPTLNNGSTSSALDPKQDDASSFRVRRVDSSASQKRDVMRQTSAHSSKGFGHFMKSFVETPMDISVGLTKGFHNMPKLWGDDTVRPHDRIGDFRSGAKAAGREFGYGWYDGVTGLVTQPWEGAQKEGVTGFAKGFGKGIGGFSTKPLAGLAGLLGHTMKGVQKELQKLLSIDVQSYIIASRTAQGYEEWLQASDAEKQDVIDRWKLIEKNLKKKTIHDDMVRDVLKAQHKSDVEGRQTRHQDSPAQSVNSAGTAIPDSQSTLNQDPQGASVAMSTLQPPPFHPTNTVPFEPLEGAELNERFDMRATENHETSQRGKMELDTKEERSVQEYESQIRRQRQEAADHQKYEESLRQAMTASETEAQRHANDALGHERLLKQVMAQSLHEQSRSGHDGREWEANTGLDNEEKDEALERATSKKSGKMADRAAMVVIGESSGAAAVQPPPEYDPGHLEGTTQSEFEVQQRGQKGEKSAEEKAEEDTVMRYIKKQSLLEAYHQDKGEKDRAGGAVDDDKDYEDLQKALELSMQGHNQSHAECLNGEGSGGG